MCYLLKGRLARSQKKILNKAWVDMYYVHQIKGLLYYNRPYTTMTQTRHQTGNQE